MIQQRHIPIIALATLIYTTTILVLVIIAKIILDYNPSIPSIGFIVYLSIILLGGQAIAISRLYKILSKTTIEEEG